MFQVDPRERPDIHVIVAQLQEVAAARGVTLKGPLQFPNNSMPAHTGKLYNFIFLQENNFPCSGMWVFYRNLGFHGPTHNTYIIHVI